MTKESSDSVRAIIRAKLRSGSLRHDSPARTWHGRGQDSRCVACSRLIRGAERECEADFADGATLRFHRDCYYVWDGERQRADAPAGTADDASVLAAILVGEALCLPCIVEKTNIAPARVRAFFERVTETVQLTQATAACPVCGRVTTTYRLG